MTSIYDFAATRLDGTEAAMASYRNQVLLIVNTASKCGFTPQYEGLEALQKTYGPQGFSVLGFPCNQFGSQEPGDAAAIGSFCQLTYDVTFPMFAKIEVNGESAAPLYRFLKAAKPGVLGLQGIKWNFTKFLVDRSGAVVERFAPTTKPAAIVGRLEALLRA
jgi:glutathione peroxidase